MSFPVSANNKRVGHTSVLLTFRMGAEPSLPISRRRLYPAVGLQSKGSAIRANFGLETFHYSAMKTCGDESENESMEGFEKLEIL